MKLFFRMRYKMWLALVVVVVMSVSNLLIYNVTNRGAKQQLIHYSQFISIVKLTSIPYNSNSNFTIKMCWHLTYNLQANEQTKKTLMLACSHIRRWQKKKTNEPMRDLPTEISYHCLSEQSSQNCFYIKINLKIKKKKFFVENILWNFRSHSVRLILLLQHH